MNRLEEIANKIKLGWPENQGEYLSQCPEDFYNGMSKGMHLLIEALKPEIELMLKEQAKMVRDACVGALYEVEYAPEEKWITALEQVEHEWVKLEDK